MSKEPWFTDKWRVSPFAWNDEIRKELHIPKRVHIRSTDPRHADDHPGIVLSIEEKVKMAEVLDELGVEELDCGWPAMVQQDCDFIKALSKAGLKIKKSGVVRIIAEDVKKEMDIVAESGADNFQMISELSGRMSERLWGKGSFDKVLPNALTMIHYAKELGLPISFGFVDTLRGDLEWMKSIVRRLPVGGIERFFVYEDQVGTPAVMRFIVRQFREILGDTPILVHCHNTFGMATANALAAVEEGVEWVDCGVNGYGTVAPLEEVVCALEMLYGIGTGIKLEKLYEASKTFEKITGAKFPKPIVGEEYFVAKRGKEVTTILRTRGAWPDSAGATFVGSIFDPRVVGRRYGISWEHGAGFSTLEEGPDALRLKLDQLMLKYSDENFQELRERVSRVIKWRKCVTDAELERLCRQILEES